MAMPGRLAPVREESMDCSMAAVPEESMDCSMAAVPEESMDCSTAAYPPRSPYRDCSTAAYPPPALYRDSIRRVAVSGAQIRSNLFSSSRSGRSGSSYSSDSGPSNNSGCSSGSALSAAAADFGTHELKTIARRMVTDGYTQRMVQAFDAAFVPASGGIELEALFVMVSPMPALEYGFALDRVLETWFLELDVAWVLQIGQEHGSQWQLQLQDNSGSSLQSLVEKWIRGLTVIVHSIVELLSTRHEMTEAKRFGEASTSKMLVFIHSIVADFKAQNLRAVLDMYICVCWAFDNMIKYAELVDLKVMLLSLSRSVFQLKEAISSTMEKVRTLIECDDSWAIEIPRGGGEVHRNTRWIADCIVSLGEAEAGLIFIPNNRNVRLSGVRDDTIDYLKDLLLRKSELCLDPSQRYLFLLNNSYFAAQMSEPCVPEHDWKLTPECEKYMYSYLDVSWVHVLSCIPKSHFPGPLHRWINTSSLVKFESAFNKTYQAHKFWKVPDPRLRDFLRRAIIERVVSSYRDYLKEHPELAEHVSRRNSTPEVLEEMLGQLFEG